MNREATHHLGRLDFSAAAERWDPAWKEFVQAFEPEYTWGGP